MNDGWNVAKNIGEILTVVNSHAYFTEVEKPNQTHPIYTTYDIGCNSDMALHTRHYPWETVFDFFKHHDVAMGSFATKYVNKLMLDYNPEKKIRIRFSLMPELYRTQLEPHTSPITERLKAINLFAKAGYDVHVNFSPVIVVNDWLKEYEKLFKEMDFILDDLIKNSVHAEVIFLTHNIKKHNYNLEHKLPGEHLLWNPNIQEGKISQYGGENIRYRHDLKWQYIDAWRNLHDKILPYNTVRYIF